MPSFARLMNGMFVWLQLYLQQIIFLLSFQLPVQAGRQIYCCCCCCESCWIKCACLSLYGVLVRRCTIYLCGGSSVASVATDRQSLVWQWWFIECCSGISFSLSSLSVCYCPTSVCVYALMFTFFFSFSSPPSSSCFSISAHSLPSLSACLCERECTRNTSANISEKGKRMLLLMLMLLGCEE